MKKLVMALVLSAVMLPCYAAPAFSIEGFTPEKEKTTITLKEDRMLVRLDGVPALLFGPFKAQGSYPVGKVNGLIKYIRGSDIVFYMRDNLYAGHTNPERFPGGTAVFLSDGAGTMYYCASAILTGEKRAPCGKFNESKSVSFSVAEKPFNGFIPEAAKPTSQFEEGRLRVKLNGRTHLMFAPLVIDGPYSYTVPNVKANRAYRVLLAKDRAYVTESYFDGFRDDKVFFITDSKGVKVVCGGATLPKAGTDSKPECHRISGQ